MLSLVCISAAGSQWCCCRHVPGWCMLPSSPCPTCSSPATTPQTRSVTGCELPWWHAAVFQSLIQTRNHVATHYLVVFIKYTPRLGTRLFKIIDDDNTGNDSNATTQYWRWRWRRSCWNFEWRMFSMSCCCVNACWLWFLFHELWLYW